MNMFQGQVKAPSAIKKFLEFNLGHDVYTVELSQVKEVITPSPVTPIAGAPAHILGLINLRGVIITLVDIRKKLGITPLEGVFENGIVIFEIKGKLVGMMIDSIQKVMNVTSEQISPVPDADRSNAYLNGIIQRDGKLSLWLDPTFLVDEISTIKKAA